MTTSLFALSTPSVVIWSGVILWGALLLWRHHLRLEKLERVEPQANPISGSVIAKMDALQATLDNLSWIIGKLEKHPNDPQVAQLVEDVAGALFGLQLEHPQLLSGLYCDISSVKARSEENRP